MLYIYICIHIYIYTVNGACLKESLVFYATISCNDKNYQPKLYKGSCETSFKRRYSNHKK